MVAKPHVVERIAPARSDWIVELDSVETLEPVYDDAAISGRMRMTAWTLFALGVGAPVTTLAMSLTA